MELHDCQMSRTALIDPEFTAPLNQSKMFVLDSSVIKVICSAVEDGLQLVLMQHCHLVAVQCDLCT